MAAAIINIDKSFNETKIKAKKVSKYAHKEDLFVRVKRFAKNALFYSFIIFAVLTVVSTFGFVYFYNHYSEVVGQRVASGFWHTRSGIYAAPRVLQKNQKISKNETIELLRRSGYVENDSPERVWNGSFTVKGNSIEIKTNNYLGTEIKTANIKFAGDKITSINDGENQILEYEIQPELLTGRSEAKRGVNHALRYEEIPENLRNAILTAEDQRFFEHHGIDPKGIVRAFYENVVNREIKQGGSTITQQLVKNTFLSPERSLKRKIEEAFLALALENQMSKENIFALYCNEIYLGQYGAAGIHGVEQAARAYFDKDLKDLNLTEAAAIAAMIKNPNRYAPHKNEAEAGSRRDWIIGKMRETGTISPSEAEIAQNRELPLVKPKHDERTIAPYFVDAATKVLTTDFQRDVFNTNFNMRVYTTLDTQLQSIAEQTVADQLNKLDRIYRKKGLNLQAALVAINPKNGKILAMVGGRNYRESQFNRATDAMRQPGSTFKPFVYATALERGRTPMSIYSDRPSEFVYDNGKPYKPANFGNSYKNDEITMKTALAKSSNVVAVEAAMESGLRSVARVAEEFGFTNIEPYPSMALGTMEVTPLQLAAAYAVFANGGKRVEPTFISKIVSGEDNLVYQIKPSEEQIISEKTAYMITDMLQAVVERGTARKASGALGKNVAFAGKTGSSKDGWFVGYTPNLVTVAWVGFDESEDIKMTGADAALPLWTEFMKAVVQDRPEFGGESFSMPQGLTTVEIDPETGMLAGSYCPHREKVVVPSSAAPGVECLRHKPDLPDVLIAEHNEDSLDEFVREEIEQTITILPTKFSVETETPEPPEVKYKSFDGMPMPDGDRKPVRLENKTTDRLNNKDSANPEKNDKKPDTEKSDTAGKNSVKKSAESFNSKTFLEDFEKQNAGNQ